MRIEAYNQIHQIYGSTKAARSPKSREAVYSRDAVEISNGGQDYQIAKKAVREAPDVREDLIASLKERIASGTYNVSGESFADKLLSKYEDLI